MLEYEHQQSPVFILLSSSDVKFSKVDVLSVSISRAARCIELGAGATNPKTQSVVTELGLWARRCANGSDCDTSAEVVVGWT